MKDVIIDYIKKEYLDEDDDTEIDENTPLISGGIIDSFSIVSLVGFLEKKYDVKIPEVRVTNETFDTIGGIAALIQELSG